MAAVPVVLQLAPRQIEMAPALLEIRIVWARVQERRREGRALLVAIESPCGWPHREEDMHMLAPRTMECPALDDPPVDDRLKLHGLHFLRRFGEPKDSAAWLPE